MDKLVEKLGTLIPAWFGIYELMWSLIVLCAALLTIGIIRTVRYERKAKVFRSEMKAGSECRISTSELGVKGKFIRVEGDRAVVEVTVPLSRVYQTDSYGKTS